VPQTPSPGTGDIIVVNGLSKHFGTRIAVDDVSFSVGEGEFFGFLGPNGAGKSTTVNILATLTRPTSGGAFVAGYDVVHQRANVRRAIGLVFQDSTLDDYLTAEQNLRFHARAYGVPNHLARSRSQELLELMGLWERRNDKVKSFSGGMRRRLELVRGLLHQPAILFLDEPTLGLDPRSRRNVWDYLHTLRERERLTIFLTTHYLDEADACDRVAVIDDGKLVANDTPEGLKRSVGGDVILLEVADGAAAAVEILERYGIHALVEGGGGTVRFSIPDGEGFLPEFIKGFSHDMRSVSLRRPSLDDAFLALTGRELDRVDEPPGVEALS
jgi:ABC-2 type transport system ATP-binding protein